MRGYGAQDLLANVTYTPDKDYNGFDIFSFKADDGTEGSYPAPVSMLVDPVNDTPVATDETRTMSEDGGSLSIDFIELLSDVETSDANLTYGITDPDPAKGFAQWYRLDSRVHPGCQLQRLREYRLYAHRPRRS